MDTKSSLTIKQLNDFIEDPSRINDIKTWKAFREFISLLGQFSSENKIEDEYAELKETKFKIAILIAIKENSKLWVR